MAPQSPQGYWSSWTQVARMIASSTGDYDVSSGLEVLLKRQCEDIHMLLFGAHHTVILSYPCCEPSRPPLQRIAD